jgi:hypothetical protein
VAFDLDVIVYFREGIHDPVEDLFSAYLHVSFTRDEEDLICDDGNDQSALFYPERNIVAKAIS